VLAVIIVDHGSKRSDANDAFLQLVERFARRGDYEIVEAAHMDLAPPTIAGAFDAAVARGATEIVVHPYFLLPGRHWDEDLPALCREAARKHPGVGWKLTPPLGMSDRILDVIAERIEEARR
jgi:sirohydrochlorin ferrochelatase